MLAGARPFAGKSPFEVLVAVERDLPTPLEERAPDVPADLAAVVARCLAKVPQDRYADASEVIAALAGSPSGSRVLGRRAPWRGIVIAAAAVGMAALAFRFLPRQMSGSPPPPPAPSSSTAPREPREYKARRLTTFTEGHVLSAASLDRSQFVYGDSEGVWTQPIAGGTRRRLEIPPLENGDGASNIVMLADGQHAAISVVRGGHYTLFLTPLDGTPARALRKGVGARSIALRTRDAAMAASRHLFAA